MHANVGTLSTDLRDAARTGRCWQDVVLAAQLDLADDLARAIGEGRLHRASYQHWLATESALCGLDALALDALSAWHGPQPTLRAAAQGWATAMRGDALAATADIGKIDAVTVALPQPLGSWQAFVASACASARAGEALGAVVLHARLLHGPMREAIAAVVALPFVAGHAGSYLLQRGQPDTGPQQQRREALLDAYSAAALAAGAQRAADWYRAVMDAVLAPAGSVASISDPASAFTQHTTDDGPAAGLPSRSPLVA